MGVNRTVFGALSLMRGALHGPGVQSRACRPAAAARRGRNLGWTALHPGDQLLQDPAQIAEINRRPLCPAIRRWEVVEAIIDDNTGIIHGTHIKPISAV
jgi:hypothetical protein